MQCLPKACGPLQPYQLEQSIFILTPLKENGSICRHFSNTTVAKGEGGGFFIRFAFGRQSISLVTVLKKRK